MNPHSMDLRQRVVDAVDGHEGSRRQLALRFVVSVTFITRLLALRRQTGSLCPRPHRRGPRPRLDDADLQRLRQLVHDQPDAILDELAQQLGNCQRMTVWRALRKLKITRKKKVLYAHQRDRPDVQQKRQQFQQQLATLDPQRLIFVDEVNATTAMTRTYGRAPHGERVEGRVPGLWKSMTLISGVRLSGVMAPFAFPGATDTDAFRTYTEAVLVPELRQGDVVIWDNLQPHKDAKVIAAVEHAGGQVLPAPPWSPDLMPIEKMYSKVKTALRSLAARTTESLVAAMGVALERVCPQDVIGWFRSCGLVVDRVRKKVQGLLNRLKTGDCAQLSWEAL